MQGPDQSKVGDFPGHGHREEGQKDGGKSILRAVSSAAEPRYWLLREGRKANRDRDAGDSGGDKRTGGLNEIKD